MKIKLHAVHEWETLKIFSSFLNLHALTCPSLLQLILLKKTSPAPFYPHNLLKGITLCRQNLGFLTAQLGIQPQCSFPHSRQ